MADLFTKRGAEISACGRYRYLLWRRWDVTRPRLVWIMLNPSTADVETDDATIRVCMERARRMGFGGIRVANLFNYRATDPRQLDQVEDPVGPEGDQALFRVLQGEQYVVVAWGDGGLRRGYVLPRWREALFVLVGDYGMTLRALRLTKAGQPCHPLRIAYSVEPFVWADRRSWLRVYG